MENSIEITTHPDGSIANMTVYVKDLVMESFNWAEGLEPVSRLDEFENFFYSSERVSAYNQLINDELDKRGMTLEEAKETYGRTR